MLLLLHALALLRLLLAALLASTAQTLSVVSLVPLSERRSIDLDDGGFGQSVRADEFVVGRMERDGDDTAFSGDPFAAPGEVSGVETQGAKLAVSTARAD